MQSPAPSSHRHEEALPMQSVIYTPRRSLPSKGLKESVPTPSVMTLESSARTVSPWKPSGSTTAVHTVSRSRSVERSISSPLSAVRGVSPSDPRPYPHMIQNNVGQPRTQTMASPSAAPRMWTPRENFSPMQVVRGAQMFQNGAKAQKPTQVPAQCPAPEPKITEMSTASQQTSFAPQRSSVVSSCRQLRYLPPEQPRSNSPEPRSNGVSLARPYSVPVVGKPYTSLIHSYAAGAQNKQNADPGLPSPPKGIQATRLHGVTDGATAAQEVNRKDIEAAESQQTCIHEGKATNPIHDMISYGDEVDPYLYDVHNAALPGAEGPWHGQLLS
eukprot:gnl/MRDRNA2_/MRDRNA2_229585_c0_seq1.p1 gnl/MRDRNA2_/MRDRNA2_229585_c0~~gnl/MRDRNA2_/MRDRNA2_229585_c0_seq1.p1  ORF type:complete len:343 (-),score=40.41 gnl/MRDRNA2_/MRDRNA2_229585_c0_seq1:10-996(-)